MKQTGRLLTILLALVFLASAFLKALSFEDFLIEIRVYGIVTSMTVVKLLGFVVLAIEALLGLLLLFYRRTSFWVLPVIGLLLLFFSGLIVYGWAFKGLADCGCFGRYIQVTPGLALGKNFLLFIVAGLAWWQVYRLSEKGRVDVWRNGPSRNLVLGPRSIQGVGHAVGFSRWRKRWGMWRLVPSGAILIVILMCAYLSPVWEQSGSVGSPIERDEAREGLAQYTIIWDEERIDLSSGMYLVAMISDSCSECAETVAALNELCKDEELPRIVSFVLGGQETLSSFQEKYKPDFPSMLLPSQEILEYIGDAPPRFILLQDGKQFRFWDKKAPEAFVVAEAMLELL